MQTQAERLKEAKKIAKDLHAKAMNYIKHQDDKSYDAYMKGCSLQNILLLTNVVAEIKQNIR